MSTVRIVTDSNAYIPDNLRERYQIEVLPHRIRLGNIYHEETPEFTSDVLFAKLQAAGATAGATAGSATGASVPELYAADPNAIVDLYASNVRDAHEIVSIHMSSHLSPMWQNARTAAGLLRGRRTIRVVDSLSTSLGLGLLAVQAARAAEEGATLNEIARLINGSVPHLYATFFTESLHYLEHSAKLGASQSVLGTMLGIKAMAIMEAGRLIALEKVQLREELVEKLHEFVAEFAELKTVGIMQHGYEQQQEALIELLTESMPQVNVVRLPYAASSAVHLGPNMIGVVAYEENGY